MRVRLERGRGSFLQGAAYPTQQLGAKSRVTKPAKIVNRSEITATQKEIKPFTMLIGQMQVNIMEIR
jgi:hypothetical protein